jgi:hypothetical protein
VLLGLVVVSWYTVSVALDVGVGILLIDGLERGESKISRVLFVEVKFAFSLPLDDGEETVKGLSWGSVVVRFRELPTLVSLADGEFEWVLCGLGSIIAEEFDLPLDGAVSLVREKVVFAILVVGRID